MALFDLSLISLGFQLKLGLPVVFSGVDTVLGLVSCISEETSQRE